MDIVLLIIIGTLSRLAPHPANMTAIGALAVFCGAKLDIRKALLVMVSTMVLSDLVLGFHSVVWATYGSLAISVLLANYFLQKPSVTRIMSVALASSVIFYLVTNFAVWVIPGSMYPKTFAGLLDSYILAIPFFRNSLVGDFFYSGIFFGGYELIWRRKICHANVKINHI